MGVYPRTITYPSGASATYWWYDFTYRGRRIRESCGPDCHSKTRAQHLMDQRRIEIKTQMAKGSAFTGKAPLLRDAAAEFLAYIEDAYKAKSIVKSTRNHYRSAWHAWLAATDLANMRIDAINASKINAVEFPGGPFTRRNARQALGHILRWCAEERGYIVAAPRIKSTPVMGRKYRFTEEDEQALREHMDRDVCDVFSVMLDIAMRNGEVFAMEWSRVDWEMETYAIARGKTPASQRTIPLSKRVMAILRARQETAKSKWVFPSRRIKGGHITTVGKQYRAARAAAGLPSEAKLYSARHTGASELAEHGVPLLTLRAILGHENISTTNKYLHGDALKARDAINAKVRSRSGLKLEKKA